MSSLAVPIKLGPGPKLVPPSRLTHPSRSSRDTDLAREIKFLGSWTQPKLELFLPHLYADAALYDTSVLTRPISQIISGLIESAPSTYVLGDFEGIAILTHLVEGESATAHLYLWTPRFLRRPSLLKSMLRDAFERWSLERISAFIPSRNTLSRRCALSVGFKREGTQHSAVVYNKGRDSLSLYGLLRKEVL